MPNERAAAIYKDILVTKSKQAGGEEEQINTTGTGPAFVTPQYETPKGLSGSAP